MKIRAYVDESGTHGDSTHLVMGGVVSSFSKWKLFDPKWQAALRTWNGGEPVHGTELIKRRHNKELVDALFASTRSRVGFGLTVSIKRSDFKEVYRAGPAPKGVQFDSEYGLLFGCWIETARDSAKLLYSDKGLDGIWIVLERSHYFGQAAAVYAQLEAAQSADALQFRGFSSGTKQMPGIQLSDMMAHMGWRREGRNEPVNPPGDIPAPLGPDKLIPRSDDEPFPVFRAQLKPEFLSNLRDRIVAAHVERRGRRTQQTIGS